MRKWGRMLEWKMNDDELRKTERKIESLSERWRMKMKEKIIAKEWEEIYIYNIATL